jgi:hypothetical protein
MPNIRDDSTVKAIAEAFTGECKRNKVKTMEHVGYTTTYANSGRGQKTVYENVRVKNAIHLIDTTKQEKYEHNQAIAINKLYSDYDRLQERAENGDTVAIQARTAIVRELNAITGQHSTTIKTDTEVKELTDAQQAEAREYAAWQLRRQLRLQSPQDGAQATNSAAG